MTEIKKTKRNKTPTLVLLPLLLFLFVMLYMVVSTLKGVAVDPTMSADSGSGSTSVTSNEEEPTIPEDQNNQKNPEPSTTTKAAPSLAQMQQQFQQARTDLIAKFQSEDYYGSYFETLFQDMDTQFLSSPSTQKLQRRLEYKLWHVLRKDSTTPKFVWTQGGHSSAAGHGNFMFESQTASLTQMMKPIFAALGMQFVGRNYAMGGTSSASEVASCSASIFGTNNDVLVWDFGMTDGRDASRMKYYFQRAIVTQQSYHHHPPAIVALHTNGRNQKQRIDVMNEFHTLYNITALVMNDTLTNRLNELAPDTFGQNISMPKFLHYFKCDGQIENGEPGCRTHKYNLTACPSRKYQASWHPGWKYHGRVGHMNGFFLIQVLQRALATIEESLKSSSGNSASHIDAMIQKYEQEQQEIYQSFRKETLPPMLVDMVKQIHADLDPEVILRQPNFCHTARLPADIRYKGLLTESRVVSETGSSDDEIGDQPMDGSSFDEGIPKVEADSAENLSNTIRLVYDSKQQCEYPVELDFKDYFYVSDMDQGPKTLVLPNAMEKAYYQTGKFHGYIMACNVVCPWGKCPGGLLDIESLAPEDGLITINGVAVTGTSKFQECLFLMNEKNGLKWDSASEYKVSVERRKERGFFRFSAFVFW